MPEPDPDYRARTQLALSVINHRKHTPELINLIGLILEGASIQDCIDLERPSRPAELMRP